MKKPKDHSTLNAGSGNRFASLAEPTEKLTVAAIGAAYTPEKSAEHRQNPWGYYVLRPLAVYPAWFCLKLGISANQVTYVSMLTGCTGCALLGLGGYWHAIIGAILVNVGALGDYVDGAVSRHNKSSSKYGAFIDTVHGYLISTLLPVGIGVGLFNNPDSVPNYLKGADGTLFLILGFSAALFFTFALLISNRLAVVFSMTVPSDFYKTKSGLWAIIYAMGLGLLNPCGFLMVVLVFAAAFKFLSIFLFLWWALALAGLLAIVIRTVAKARTE